jgi:hypothetical protein
MLDGTLRAHSKDVFFKLGGNDRRVEELDL